MSYWCGHRLPRYWLNMISECVYRSDFGWDNFWISGLSKTDCPPPSGWASSDQLKAWLDKSLRKHFLSLYLFKLDHLPTLDLDLDWKLQPSRFSGFGLLLKKKKKKGQFSSSKALLFVAMDYYSPGLILLNLYNHMN